MDIEYEGIIHDLTKTRSNLLIAAEIRKDVYSMSDGVWKG